MSSTTPGNVVPGPTHLADRLPHDPEAERAVLGAVLLDPGAMLHIIEKLRVDEFYLESHRIVYQSCLDLHEKGEAADLVTTRNHLTEQGRLEQVGGASYLSSLVDAGAISARTAKEATTAILAREKQATTGIGKGVALPHAKIKSVKQAIGTIGRSDTGIEFSALDSKPVYIVILLLSNPDNPDEHLQAMETIFKHVQRDIFRKFLRQSDTTEAIADLIVEADELT